MSPTPHSRPASATLPSGAASFPCAASFRRAARRRPLVASAALLLLLALALLPALPAGAADDWQRVSLGEDGRYFVRYVPPGVELPAPTVLFLHGSGAFPDQYRRWLVPAADAARLVLVIPRSSTRTGWGYADDDEILAESLERMQADGYSDLGRLTAAGHSSGAAYAFLLTYRGGLPAHAVFTLASPFYPVAGPLAADPPPPIHMYYGHDDPNYEGGSYQRLADQWGSLGVPWEADLQAGYGHGSWPQSSMDAGLAFLAAHTPPPDHEGGGDTCAPGDTVLCLRDGRYRVEVDWQDFQGNVGAGHVVDVGGGSATGDGGGSGIFWFFQPSNWELMVKVLDGCGINGHAWVFSAATTNVAYTLRVTDTATGVEWRHDNAAGDPAPAVVDTTAFACPPG